MEEWSRTMGTSIMTAPGVALGRYRKLLRSGVYGLSIFDNTYKIHFKTSYEGSVPVMTSISGKDRE